MPTPVYNGEDVFRAWCDMGSAASNPRLIEYCRAKYGQASQMGPTYAMWHWAFYHPEQAYEMYKEWWFHARTDQPPLMFEDFLKILQHKGTGTKGLNPSIASSLRDLERFCAKYGLEMQFRVAEGDVVQVLRNIQHPETKGSLYRTLMIVDEVNHEKVKAHFFMPDKVYPEVNGIETVNCELNIRDIGVIGKAIV